MNRSEPSPPARGSSAAAVPARSRRQWLGALGLGAVLWFVAVAAAHVLPQVFFGLRLEGWPYGVVGVLQLLLVPPAIALALRPARIRLADLGLRAVAFWADVAIGTAVAVVFALLQFLVIIPATGGAERSDVAMNAAQIGDSIWGVVGFVVLAWTGGASEELFFRGHLVTCLRGLLGDTRLALTAVTILTAAVFAALHGYQGWAGVLDTGLYGGVTLTLLFLWRRRLTAPIVAHALWNSIAAVVIYSWA